MNKMIITTDQGKVHDWVLNGLINLVLWFKKVDNKKDAIKVTAKVMNIWTWGEQKIKPNDFIKQIKDKKHE